MSSWRKSLLISSHLPSSQIPGLTLIIRGTIGHCKLMNFFSLILNSGKVGDSKFDKRRDQMYKGGHYIHVITKRLLLIGASLLTYGWLSETPHWNPLILFNVSVDQRFGYITERKIIIPRTHCLKVCRLVGKWSNKENYLGRSSSLSGIRYFSQVININTSYKGTLINYLERVGVSRRDFFEEEKVEFCVEVKH